MHYILDNWSFDPFIVLVAVVVAWHEIGLFGWPGGRGRSGPGSGASVALVLLRAACAAARRRVDPLTNWADSYFMVHHVQHLLTDVRRAFAHRRGRARATTARRAPGGPGSR